MLKIGLNNYRDGKDQGKIVAAVGRVLARQRYVSPIEVFVEMGLLMADDVEGYVCCSTCDDWPLWSIFQMHGITTGATGCRPA